MASEQNGINLVALNLQDLLVDEQSNELSDYLSLSIEAFGENTRVSVTTVEDTPTIYSSILNGVSFVDLQSLLEGPISSISE